MEDDAWDQVLIKQFPKLLVDLSSMECGKGWKNLLVGMFMNVIRAESQLTDHPSYIPVRFVQIKEKFGGLRAYYEGGYFPDGITKPIASIVAQAETESMTTCDVCGSTITDPASLTTKRGWIHTACNNCR